MATLSDATSFKMFWDDQFVIVRNAATDPALAAVGFDASKVETYTRESWTSDDQPTDPFIAAMVNPWPNPTEGVFRTLRLEDGRLFVSKVEPAGGRIKRTEVPCDNWTVFHMGDFDIASFESRP